MSLPRELARLAFGTIGKTLDGLALVILVPLGLLLFVGIAGVVFAPVLRHLQDYWWVYLLALCTLLFLLVYVASMGVPSPNDPSSAASELHASPRLSQTERTSSQPNGRALLAESEAERPTSGKALFRFTEEWLTSNGLYEGRDMSKADAVSIAGRTAIAYHLREGNFVERDGRIALTDKGHSHFSKRRDRL